MAIDKKILKVICDEGCKVSNHKQQIAELKALFQSHAKSLVPEEENDATPGEDMNSYGAGWDAGFNACRKQILEEIKNT